MPPLAGLKVVELARVLAGPWAGQVLADLGAEVVKVESLAGDETRATGGLEKRGGLRGDENDEARGSGRARACGQREEELGGRLGAASCRGPDPRRRARGPEGADGLRPAAAAECEDLAPGDGALPLGGAREAARLAVEVRDPAGQRRAEADRFEGARSAGARSRGAGEREDHRAEREPGAEEKRDTFRTGRCERLEGAGAPRRAIRANRLEKGSADAGPAVQGIDLEAGEKERILAHRRGCAPEDPAVF